MNPLDAYLQIKEAKEKLAHPLDKATGIKRVGQLITGSRIKPLVDQANAAGEVVGKYNLPHPEALNSTKGLIDEVGKVGWTRAGAAGGTAAGVAGAVGHLKKRTKASEKTAGAAGRFAQGMAQGAKRVLDPSELGRIGTQAAVVGGAGLLIGAAQKTYLAITKKRDFDAMLKHNPDLAEHQEANPQMFNQHYSSLRSMNPMFAKDPVVAGSYMRQMSMNPGTAGKVLVESLNSLQKGGPKNQMLSGISAMQGNANMGMAERKHDFDQDKYEQQLAEKEQRNQEPQY